MSKLFIIVAALAGSVVLGVLLAPTTVNLPYLLVHNDERHAILERCLTYKFTNNADCTNAHQAEAMVKERDRLASSKNDDISGFIDRKGFDRK
jgi:hypothetical protein